MKKIPEEFKGHHITWCPTCDTLSIHCRDCEIASCTGAYNGDCIGCRSANEFHNWLLQNPQYIPFKYRVRIQFLTIYYHLQSLWVKVRK